MRRRILNATLLLSAGVTILAACSRTVRVEEVLAGYSESADYPASTIVFPLSGTEFPPDLAPATFTWREAATGSSTASDQWLLIFRHGDNTNAACFLSGATEWKPSPSDWERIKQSSRREGSELTVVGFQRADPRKVLSRGRTQFRTSEDPVGAPVFYREVNLPFMEAVKDPSRIRWRFGTVDSQQPPPVVLQGLPVCGNCHSFSRDGSVLGMDVDYANDKGSYITTRVEKDMTLASSDVLNWSDFRPEDKAQTFGLLSQVSPDGRSVISTVKDKSVFVARPGIEFSQLFFPIKGILAVYHRGSRTFEALPGADDPRYVQSNPTWSPDGKEIVFARAEAYQLKSRSADGKLLLSDEDCAEFLREGKTFQFELYRIPYNEGRGGKAEPIAGASRNGKSNFFPKYSPDGKWIVFCQAQSFMLLQPDSELFIIPSAGGEARRLRCNTARMNSWHSWSPNGRWLVFSSKANGPFTQLFLTHIDDQGESTPPVPLSNFTSTNGAANIPEFVNVPGRAIERIREQFLDDHNLSRAAYVLEVTGEVEAAMTQYEKALGVNPKNVLAHQRLGFLLFNYKRQLKEGLAHTTEALRLDPGDGCAHYDLAMALRYQRRLAEAIPHFAEAVRLLPAGFDTRYNVLDMRVSLGDALLENGEAPRAEEVFLQALSLNRTNARTHYLLAMATAAQGKTEESLRYYGYARESQPAIDTSTELHLLIASNLARDGRREQALESARRGLELARASGNAELVQMAAQSVRELEASAQKR